MEFTYANMRQIVRASHVHLTFLMSDTLRFNNHHRSNSSSIIEMAYLKFNEMKEREREKERKKDNQNVTMKLSVILLLSKNIFYGIIYIQLATVTM